MERCAVEGFDQGFLDVIGPLLPGLISHQLELVDTLLISTTALGIEV